MMIEKYNFLPYQGARYSAKESADRAKMYRELLEKRRSVREFSSKSVSKSLIEDLIMTGSSAPSGANKQPWTFCAISDPAIKSEIRKAAEKEEHLSYTKRMSEEWLKDLAPLGTNWEKPFLEIAPWIIVIFKKIYDLESGEKTTNYYVNESVGIATGMFISAIHNAGLVTLTHTPSPMRFLHKILDRPENEKPYLLLPVGYPADECEIPDITKKGSREVIEYY
jgi:nitroreductase